MTAELPRPDGRFIVSLTARNDPYMTDNKIAQSPQNVHCGRRRHSTELLQKHWVVTLHHRADGSRG